MKKTSAWQRRTRVARDYVAAEIALLAGKQPEEAVTPVQAARSWLAALGSVPPPKARVVITALRNPTWMEWAVYCACVIRRLGYESTLLVAREDIERHYSSGPSVRGFWKLAEQVPGLVLHDLSVEETAGQEDDWITKRAVEWAPVAVAYDEHLEEQDIRMNPARFGGRIDASAQRAQALGRGLHRLLSRGSRFDRAFCYSGLIGESRVLLDVFRHHEVSTVCLEGWAWRPGHMIYNLNEPALEYNVRGWLHSLGEWDAAKERVVDEYLNFLDGRERDAAWLQNFYRIQRDVISARLPPVLKQFVTGPEPIFLLAPNVIGDSSTLRRETIFPSMQEWIRDVINWFRARPHLKLVVRAHPAEQWIGAKCAVFIGEGAAAAAAGAPNVHVLPSSDPTNTFSLVPYLRAGLIWLSSAGVDLVARGVPACVAASPKYRDLGITEEPTSREDYFRLLEDWGETAVRPTASQITFARRYLHLVFKGFSFEASSRNYRATGLRLGAMPNQAEHDHFYRIILGEESMPDRAL